MPGQHGTVKNHIEDALTVSTIMDEQYPSSRHVLIYNGANSCSKVPIAFRWFLTFSLTNLKSVREGWNGILWLVVNLSCDEGLAFCVIVDASGSNFPGNLRHLFPGNFFSFPGNSREFPGNII